MKLKDAENAQIRNGNVLIVPCQGAHDCGGMIRVPFTPTIGGAPEAEPTAVHKIRWKREAGESLEDLTLSPSIDAGECGHFFIRNGQITQ